MYIISILWFLSLPVVIYVSYRVIRVVTGRFDKAEEKKGTV
jgi:hypothetical protein